MLFELIDAGRALFYLCFICVAGWNWSVFYFRVRFRFLPLRGPAAPGNGSDCRRFHLLKFNFVVALISWAHCIVLFFCLYFFFTLHSPSLPPPSLPLHLPFSFFLSSFVCLFVCLLRRRANRILSFVSNSNADVDLIGKIGSIRFLPAAPAEEEEEEEEAECGIISGFFLSLRLCVLHL